MNKNSMRSQIKLIAIVFILLLITFVVFEWRFVQYPSKPDENDPVICYSPNHEYYIKRYQSFFDSLFNDGGLAIVYNKKGDKIAQGNAYLVANSIIWTPSYGGAVGVGQGGVGYEWYTRLPSLPVKVKNTEDDYGQGCY